MCNLHMCITIAKSALYQQAARQCIAMCTAENEYLRLRS